MSEDSALTPRWQKLLKEYAEALIIAVILAFFIRSFVIQAFKIPSGSMLQTLQIGDHLLVNKFRYGLKVPFTNIQILDFSDPKFQDIIVFEYPEDPSKDFIKRVIGLPGDTIEVRDKQLLRNGKKIQEPYKQVVKPHYNLPIIESGYPFVPPTYAELKWSPLWTPDNFGPITVPEGKFFVMGDNRDESLDSRFWGYVDENLIHGKALIIYWSWRGFSDIRWERIGDVIH